MNNSIFFIVFSFVCVVCAGVRFLRSTPALAVARTIVLIHQSAAQREDSALLDEYVF